MVFGPPEPVLAKLTTRTLAGNNRGRVVGKHARHRREVADLAVHDPEEGAVMAAWLVVML